MELHDGALTADSAPEQGTTVRIVFPRERVVAVPTGGGHSGPVVVEARG